MAYPNKTIYNPAIRQQIRFVQTSRETKGGLLHMIATYSPHSTKPAPHYHPYQEEEFKVLSGALSIEIEGTVRTLLEGDSLKIPRNTAHAMWNPSDKETVMQWKVMPALNTEHLLETLCGLATDGKTNSAGIPSLLQVVLIARKFSSAFRLAKPSFTVQQIVFALLAPLSYLLGYKPVYKKYVD
jgi:quercetin dioxygenase-like cupin family protein